MMGKNTLFSLLLIILVVILIFLLHKKDKEQLKKLKEDSLTSEEYKERIKRKILDEEVKNLNSIRRDKTFNFILELLKILVPGFWKFAVLLIVYFLDKNVDLIALLKVLSP